MKRRNNKCCPVAAVTCAEVLPTWRTVVIELDRLVSVVTCCLRPGRRIISCLGRSGCYKSYCEKTLSEVVVESVSMVRSMSICSINVSAVRVVISRVNGSPAV